MKKIAFVTIISGFLALANQASAIILTSVVPGIFNPAADPTTTITFDSANPGYVASVDFPGYPTTGIRSGVLDPGISAPPYGDPSNYGTAGGSGVFGISFNQDMSGLEFLWGSVDGYNVLNFFLDGVSAGSLTGYDLSGDQGPNGTALVNITGVTFDRIEFTNSGNGYAFEFDNIRATPASVPDGGMTVTLLGISIAGLGWLRRKLA